jgi:lactoylglutathione lyase
VIGGVNKVVVEVDDQARALTFWTERLGFDLVQDRFAGTSGGSRSEHPTRGLILILSPRQGDPPSAPDMLPTSNLFFDCDDLVQTYEDLRERGVAFPQAPIEQSFGWWSMFADEEGNRFALRPREAA